MDKVKALIVLLVALFVYRCLPASEDVGKVADQVHGKNVLVTGASSGIGEQAAYQYAQLGANVFVTARREDRLKKVVSQCGKLGQSQTFGYIAADMGDEDDIKKVIQKAVEHLGGLDILVLNHGISGSQRFWTGAKEDITTLDNVMKVTFRSFVLLTSSALPYLQQSNGSITVVSSTSGSMPLLLSASYVSAKHAVNGFFRTLRSELMYKNTDVSVTIINLGRVETDMLTSGLLSASQALNLPEKCVMGSMLHNAVSAEDTAKNMVVSTALGIDEVWYPSTQNRWWWKLLHHWKPYYVENFNKLAPLWCSLMY